MFVSLGKEPDTKQPRTSHVLYSRRYIVVCSHQVTNSSLTTRRETKQTGWPDMHTNRFVSRLPPTGDNCGSDKNGAPSSAEPGRDLYRSGDGGERGAATRHGATRCRRPAAPLLASALRAASIRPRPAGTATPCFS